jgi:hypothetical protein
MNCLIVKVATPRLKALSPKGAGKRMGKPQKTSEARSQQSEAFTLTQQQTAAYIADVSLGLRGIADRAQLPFLTYLLDMTVQEAMQQSELPRRRRSDKP